MRMSLENIIKGVVICGTLVIGGCGSFTVCGGTRYIPKDITRIDKPLEPINIPHLVNTKEGEEETTLEALSSRTADLNKINLIGIENRKYELLINSIDLAIKEKRYEDIQTTIHSLARELENKSEEECKRLLNDVKNFSYIRFEYINEEYKTGKRPTRNPFLYLAAPVVYASGVACSVVVMPIDLVEEIYKVRNSTNKDDIDFTTPASGAHKFMKKRLIVNYRKRIKPEHYRCRLVNPYSGTETVLKEFVPIKNGIPVEKK